MKISLKCWTAGFALSAAALTVCDAYLRWPAEWSSSALLLVMLAVGAFLNGLYFSVKEKRMRVIALVYGVLFAAAQLCGERLENTQTLALNAGEVWLMLAGTALCAPAAGGLFALLVRLTETVSADRSRKWNDRKVFWASALILFVCWLPFLAAYYPGLYTYDVSYQFLQYNTGEINMHHPLLHTLLIGGFYDLGWHLFGYPVRGILMYALFQMALLALAIAASVSCLCRCRAPRWTVLLALACGALMPFNQLLSISTTKDTLFSAAVLWTTVLAFEAFRSPDTARSFGWKARFALALCLTCLLRNNGFICAAGLMLAGLLTLRQHPALGKRLLCLCVCAVVAYAAVNTGLQKATDAADGPKGEMFSVPAQQLARVYVMTDDEAKPEIKAYLPGAPNYSHKLADFVKNTFDVENVSLPDFLKLWAEVGLRHPVIYLEAVAETTRGFWHLDNTPAGQYLETAFHTDEANWLMEDSKWPELKKLATGLYSNNEYREIPLYSAVLAPAFWCRALIWLMFAALYLRRKSVLYAGFAVLALYLTTLLGPCVMFRYIYPVALCVPFLFGCLLAEKERNA